MLKLAEKKQNEWSRFSLCQRLSFVFTCRWKSKHFCMRNRHLRTNKICQMYAPWFPVIQWPVVVREFFFLFLWWHWGGKMCFWGDKIQKFAKNDWYLPFFIRGRGGQSLWWGETNASCPLDATTDSGSISLYKADWAMCQFTLNGL